MLDQNTDRMWYVIGAVIIGAAIIFILNGTMPQLFASVGETFEKKVEDTATIVDDISVNGGNLINPTDGTIDAYLHINAGGAYNPQIPDLDLQYGELITNYTIHDTTGYIKVDSGSSYQFSSVYGNGLYFVRVAYYDHDKKYVDGEFYANTDSTGKYGYAGQSVDLITPSGAMYMRISADKGVVRTGPIENWRLVELNK